MRLSAWSSAFGGVVAAQIVLNPLLGKLQQPARIGPSWHRASFLVSGRSQQFSDCRTAKTLSRVIPAVMVTLAAGSQHTSSTSKTCPLIRAGTLDEFGPASLCHDHQIEIGNPLCGNGVGKRFFVRGLPFKALEQSTSVGFFGNDGLEYMV